MLYMVLKLNNSRKYYKMKRISKKKNCKLNKKKEKLKKKKDVNKNKNKRN